MAIIFYTIITIVTQRLWWNSIVITFQPSPEIVRWSLRSRSSTRPLSPPSTRHRPDSGVWDQHTPTAFKTPCKAAAGAPQDNLGRRMIPGERKPTWNKIQHAVFLHFARNQLCEGDGPIRAVVVVDTFVHLRKLLDAETLVYWVICVLETHLKPHQQYITCENKSNADRKRILYYMYYFTTCIFAITLPEWKHIAYIKVSPFYSH